MKNKNELINIFNNSKNSILKASVLSSQINDFKGIPNDIVRREKMLATKIRFLENTSVYSFDTSTLHSSKEQLFNLEAAQNNYAQLLDSIEMHYPAYYELKFGNREINGAELISDLNENVAIFDFFIGIDSIWLLSITADETIIYSKSCDNTSKQLLQEYRNSLVDYTLIINEDSSKYVFDQFVDKSQKIYDYLVRKPINELPAKINSLVIIPDGILNFIPFETLLQNNKYIQESDYRKLSYLLDSFVISYSYSTSLINIKNDIKYRSSSNYSGYAPQYNYDYKEDTAEGQNLSDLPYARKSVEQSAKLFQGNSYLSENATRNNFLNTSNESSILHLAMHCIIDNASPMETKLIFNKGKQDEFASLDVAELYNLRLDNQLSVLTACNTGVGNIREGEGVISLSRAFSYAGSQSLMMSLWRVPDVQTTELVESFFTNLKKGTSKDISLQHAKIDYINTAPRSASHPMFWAGFILTGDTDPIHLIPGRSWYVYLVTIVLISCLFLLYQKRFAKK